ncbi:hypothetical protein NBRC116589_13420 [Ruegeria sp. HU-ET01832]|uniref:hypothetical protein n=1 Tax=Ruegeria sp. HU-ET01832 TaxID=3135906 RepID=UPI00310B89EF
MKKTKCRQSEPIGLRIDPMLKQLLIQEANAQGVSPTSCARQILAEGLNYNVNLPAQASPKRHPKKAVSADLHRAVAFLACMQDARRELRAISWSLRQHQAPWSQKLAAILALKQVNMTLSRLQHSLIGTKE